MAIFNVPRRKIKLFKKPENGTPFVYLLLIILALGAFSITGGNIPVNPNSAKGPPTLPPYYNPQDEGIDQKILPINDEIIHGTDKKLQLKTFKINSCMNNIAVDFLVDTSGSFAYDGKMDNLKKSLRSFTEKMSNMSVVGMQSFSARIYERVPLDYYKNQKIQMEANIEGLESGGNTRTRSGLSLAQKLIIEAKNANKFKGYQYFLVLLTDGIPELNPSQSRTCEGPEVPDPLTAPALRCFAREEDPRYPTNIAEELKANDVKIFSIGIYSPNRPSDAALQPQLEEMLKEVASTPAEDYYFSSVHGGDLDQILDKIFFSICQ